MKRIRLNVLVVLLLLLVLIISSLAFLFSSVFGFDQFKEFALKTTKADIESTSEAVFNIDIDQQANMANTIFNGVSGYARVLSYEAFKSSEDDTKRETKNIRLKYDKVKNTHIFFDKKSVENQGIFNYGYMITDFNEENRPKTDIEADCSELLKSLELAKKITSHSKLIISTWIMDRKGLCLYYSSYINEAFNNFNYNKIKDINYFFERVKKYKEQAYYSKIYAGFTGKDTLTVIYPALNKNYELIGFAGINISYDQFLKILYNRNLKNYYTEKNIVRFFINNDGYLMFCPRKYMDIFSLPKDEEFLIIRHNNFYNANLAGSKSPVVRALVNNIIKKDSGQENITIDGSKYTVSYKAIPENNWNMAVMIKTDDLYSTFNYLKQSFDRIFNNIIVRFLIVFLVIAVLSMLIGYFIFKKQIVVPVERLIKKIKVIGHGNFNIKVKEKGIQEIFELGKTFNELGVELKGYTKKLESEIIKREAVEKEIKLARHIQESVIPVLEDKFNTDKYCVRAKLLPARDVSGDFYDTFFIDENKLALIVADVSGKGFPAAFFMAMARTTIRNICLAEPGSDPGYVLTKANKTLVIDNSSIMFVTAFLCFYEVDTGKLTYSNAGHIPPIIFNDKNELERLNVNSSAALGIFDDEKYSSGTRTLKHGETLIIFTDGEIKIIVHHSSLPYEAH